MLDRSGKPWFLFFLLIALSGCARDLGDNELTWLWAVAPFFSGLALGTSWAVWHRKRQLARWDLRMHPAPPDRREAWALGWTLGAIAVLFGVLNLVTSDVATTQRLLNVLGWFGASVAAWGIAVFWGGRLGERGYPKREKGNG